MNEILHNIDILVLRIKPKIVLRRTWWVELFISIPLWNLRTLDSVFSSLRYVLVTIFFSRVWYRRYIFSTSILDRVPEDIYLSCVLIRPKRFFLLCRHVDINSSFELSLFTPSYFIIQLFSEIHNWQYSSPGEYDFALSIISQKIWYVMFRLWRSHMSLAKAVSFLHAILLNVV